MRILPALLSLWITLAVAGPSFASDVEAPVLTDFSFTPQAVDTTESPASITVTISVTDDLSGLSSGYVGFESPSGGDDVIAYFNASHLVEGDSLDGRYEFTLTFQQFVEPGTWTIRQQGAGVWLTDQVGNASSYRAADLDAMGLPTQVQVTSTEDDEAPTLIDLSFSPDEIDVTETSETVTVTVVVEDDLSGFSSGSVLFEAPSGSSWIGSSFFPSDRVEGDALNGTYSFTVDFEPFIEPGTWRIRQQSGAGVVLRDQVGNIRTYDATAVAALGLETELEVTSVHDEEAPILVDLWFEPAHIDTSEGEETVQVYLEATDDASGIAWVSVVFESPDASSTIYRSTSGTSLVAGDPTNGTYLGPVTFPQHDLRGEWRLRALSGSAVCLRDNVGNLRCYDGDDVAAMGIETVIRNGDCCFVDRQCIDRDAVHPSDPCRVCDPDTEIGDWSVTEGDACTVDDGLACTASEGVCTQEGSCDVAVTQGCAIDDACWIEGDAEPGNPCIVCDPLRDRTSWSPVDMGAPCGEASCAEGVERAAPTCDGEGICTTSEPQACGAYLECDGDRCASSCTHSAECADSATCFESECVAAFATGAACTADNQCNSGACADGVCCDRVCDDLCEACIESATGLPDGTCADVLDGEDPRRDCEAEDPASCGLDGACDGAGACRLYAAETACMSPECTPGGFFAAGGWCDGEGACDVAEEIDCGLYACDVGGCLHECSGDEDCVGGATCADDACIEVPDPAGKGCSTGGGAPLGGLFAIGFLALLRRPHLWLEAIAFMPSKSGRRRP